jgi:hypothetical protein
MKAWIIIMKGEENLSILAGLCLPKARLKAKKKGQILSCCPAKNLFGKR